MGLIKQAGCRMPITGMVSIIFCILELVSVGAYKRPEVLNHNYYQTIKKAVLQWKRRVAAVAKQDED